MHNQHKRVQAYPLDSLLTGMTETLACYDALVRRADNMEWFTNLWEYNANREEFFPFIKTLKPSITERDWDMAWQCRTILHEDFDAAILELINALAGWY